MSHKSVRLFFFCKNVRYFSGVEKENTHKYSIQDIFVVLENRKQNKLWEVKQEAS